MTSALQVDGLVVELGGRRIVDDVAFEVELGQWISIVGPNGAGKTTLLHAITGMARPAAGTIRLLGDDARSMGARARARSVALVPQTPVIPDGVRVVDYVLLGRTPHIPFFGFETDDDVAKAHGLLVQLGVDELAGRRVESLSGGERQRVYLARALLQEAPVVLLDEPTTALDIGHQQEVLELVDHLRRDGQLAVLSTMHDLTLAGLYADELLLLDGGRVADRGPAAGVLTEDRVRDHFGARVSVLAGADGPVVVPYRLAREDNG